MIVYLHGFGSTGLSPKVDKIVSRFPYEQVMAPNLPFDPHEVEQIVLDIVKEYVENKKKNEKLIFVGTSLGAFYARYFSNIYDCPAILVNPSLMPSVTLKQKLGVNVNYHTKEEFLVKMCHLNKLEDIANHIDLYAFKENNVHIFLAKDDEVIPYEIALKFFTHGYNVSNNQLKVMDDGGHRFDKHWDLVLNKIEELI